ncbi:MAG: Rieske 2Fe-2S domain-containing protein [Chloroflexi bacterium]|nr:Rieske 2Fe-2S domain-containing protein [Chloroflexota bacterium]
MVSIHVLPDEASIELLPGETILRASLRAGVPHAHACGGQAQCSTCRVWVLQGIEHCAPRGEKERALAEPLRFDPHIRLACQTTVAGVAGNVKLRRLVLDDDDLEITSRLGQTIAIREGQEQHVAIMFADIRGFTAFSEPLPPYDVIFILNRYFHQMGKAIYRHGGTIDNYMGDGLMALFGISTGENASDPAGAPLDAIRAGLDMLEAMEDLNAYLAANYDRALDMGIGIHYGKVVLGTLGYAENRRLTTVGDAVNLASRIESANKEARTRFLISEALYVLVRDSIRTGRRAEIELKGKTGTYPLYEVLGLAGQALTDDGSGRLSGSGTGVLEQVDDGEMVWIKVLPQEHLSGTSPQEVKLDGRTLLLFQRDDLLFAVEHRCPHLRLPLNRARITDDLCLVCPWHHSAYDLRTGTVRAWSPWPPLVGPALAALRERRSLYVVPACLKDGFICIAAEH